MLTHGYVLAATPRALGLDVQSLARYYRAVADWILPHVEDRPLGLLRSLDEQDLPFFQKHAKRDSPVELIRVPVREHDGIAMHLAITDARGLLSLPQIEALEIHVWAAKRQHLERPDRLIFDLDPARDVSWKELVEGALLTRDALLGRGIVSYAMTTGSRGVHVVSPLIPRAEWREARTFAKELVDGLAAQYPSRFVTTPAVTERAGRIFVDHLRNDWGATSIAPYSTRARRGAFVAAPVTWEELAEVNGPAPFDLVSMPKRLAALERDPWEGFWQIQQAL